MKVASSTSPITAGANHFFGSRNQAFEQITHFASSLLQITGRTLLPALALAKLSHRLHPHTPPSLTLVTVASSVLWPLGYVVGASINSVKLNGWTFYEDVACVDEETVLSFGTTSNTGDSSADRTKRRTALLSQWHKDDVNSWTLGDLNEHLLYNSLGYAVIPTDDKGALIGGSLYPTGSIEYMPFIGKVWLENSTIAWINTFTGAPSLKRFKSPAREVYVIKILSDRTIVAVGSYNKQGLLLRLRPDGSLLAAKLFGRQGITGSTIINSLSLSPSGDLVVGGESDQDAFVAQLTNTSLESVWHETFGYTYTDSVLATAVTSKGEIVAGGQYATGADGKTYQGFVKKWDVSKTAMWTVTLDLTDQVVTLLVDSSDAIFVGGGDKKYGMQVTELSQSGDKRWMRALGTAFETSGVRGATLTPSRKSMYVVGSTASSSDEKGLIGLLPLDGKASDCKAWHTVKHPSVSHDNFTSLPSEMKSENWSVISTSWTNLSLHQVDPEHPDECWLDERTESTGKGIPWWGWVMIALGGGVVLGGVGMVAYKSGIQEGIRQWLLSTKGIPANPNTNPTQPLLSQNGSGGSSGSGSGSKTPKATVDDVFGTNPNGYIN